MTKKRKFKKSHGLDNKYVLLISPKHNYNIGRVTGGNSGYYSIKTNIGNSKKISLRKEHIKIITEQEYDEIYDAAGTLYVISNNLN